MDTSRQLKRGRHQLSRDEVKSNQRARILDALDTVMSARGYADTSVADIIKAAEVSRQTFYELFACKEECFLESFARRQGSIVEAIVDRPPSERGIDGFAPMLRGYLTVMAADPGLSRLHLIGVYTAGPRATAKRLALQQQFVGIVASLFDAHTAAERFSCRAVVAAISTLVTNALIEDDDGASVLALYEPLLVVTKRLMAAEGER